MAEKDHNIKHIIALSGGKDSTALALRLREVEPRGYEYICNETGNELPDMKAHWRRLEVLLNRPIKRVGVDHTLIEECRIQQMLPNVFRRWCTRILKIEPTIEYMRNQPPGSVLYVGLRADENERGGLYDDCITVRFPMREWGWGELDVWGYLESRDVCIPKRTDCAICPYQRLGEWRDLLERYPALYAEGIALEDEIGATIRTPGRDTWPASMRELKAEFESGRKLRQYKLKNKCRICSM